MNRYEKAKEYTKKYKNFLSPCHACGNNDVRIVPDRTIFPPRNVWGVVCATYACECTDTYTSVKDAVRQWKEINKKPYNNAQNTEEN